MSNHVKAMTESEIFIILAGKTEEEIKNVKASIAERFQVKDMRELKYILGLQVI